jgi:predicted RNA binding protein YcfA (HicA-like mRNA interferase family)
VDRSHDMSDEKLPTLKPEELIKALEKMGFFCSRKSKGSHFRYTHPDGRKTTVPVHKGKDIGRGLLRKILRDVDISVQELKKVL